MHVPAGASDVLVIVAIDLDKCRDPETGVIEDWALEGYSHHRQLHGGFAQRARYPDFLLGRLPPHGRKRGHFECYQTGRYVTVTGQHIAGTPLTIEARQTELEQVHRDLRRTKTGRVTDQRYRRLPAGRPGRRRGGAPCQRGQAWRAVPAALGRRHQRLPERFRGRPVLCNYLAFWCGTPERIDQLFRQSGRMPKWDSRRLDSTYGHLTVVKSLAGRTEFDTATAPAECGVMGNLASHLPRTTTGRRRRRPPRTQATSMLFLNYALEETRQGDKKHYVKVGHPVAAIAGHLFRVTNNWPKRVGPQLFVQGDDVRPFILGSTDSLFAWIGGTLPHRGANGLHWSGGEDKVTQAQFFSYLQQTVENYDAVEAYPHHPRGPRTYYMHPEPQGGDGKALAELAGRFRPATPVDHDLIISMLLTLLWGGEPGQRPAFLLTAKEGDAQGGRGVGKSKLVQLLARLVGGHVDVLPTEPIKDVTTRLLSPEGMAKRVVLADNVKTLRFSDAGLEGLITSDTISGHRMYTGEGCRPNTLTYCITLNGASLSRDMAQRCIPVHLRRPPHDGTWERDTITLIDAKRWDIIGDILAVLQTPAPPLARHSRWGTWETEVLAHVGDPSEFARVIGERQGDVDEDAAEADVVREAFRSELEVAATTRTGRLSGSRPRWLPRWSTWPRTTGAR